MTGAIVATGPLAALAVDKAATLQRLTAFNAQLEQEAQMQRDAARYRWIRDASLEELLVLVDLIAGDFDEYIDAKLSIFEQ